jgi:hypothetical protein
MDRIDDAQKTTHAREAKGLQKLRMTVYPISDLEHNQQIFAGLELLRSKDEIEFSYQFDGIRQFGLKPHFVRGAESASSIVVCSIEHIGDVAFDLSDGGIVVEPIYERSFLYFKRSYSMALHGSRNRLLPLGLNYEAQSPLNSISSAISRAVRLYRSPRTTGRALCRALHLPYPPILDAKHGGPLTLDQDPRVLFVARLYDPQIQGSSAEQRSQIHSLNEMRANCVRTLRREFSDVFTGGLISDAFAQKHYPDCVVPRSFPTDRRSFLRLIEGNHICVATTGLFDSIGWKFAEYLALGRAVVSETLHFSVPGPFSEGVNYLTFSSADECARQCRLLRSDAMTLRRMMIANRAYYLGYVEPEAIVRNALQIVLASCNSHGSDGLLAGKARVD